MCIFCETEGSRFPVSVQLIEYIFGQYVGLISSTFLSLFWFFTAAARRAAVVIMSRSLSVCVCVYLCICVSVYLCMSVVTSIFV